MEKYLLLTIFVLSVILAQAQEGIGHQEEFKQRMIETGERNNEALGHIEPGRKKLKAFTRNKAWNISTKENDIFSETKPIEVAGVGGRVLCTLVDEENDIRLVAPAGGGIWNFNDDGTNFNALDDFGSFLSVTYLTQNPFDKNTILASTGDQFHGVSGSGIFVSKDGGKSFELLPSADTEKNIDFGMIRYVKYSPEVEGTIYCATTIYKYGQTSKVYRSTDNGETWEAVFISEKGSINAITFMADEKVVIACNFDGIYVSENGDKDTFKKVSGEIEKTLGEKENHYIRGVVVGTCGGQRDVAVASFVCATTAEETGKNRDVGYTYKTTDGGKTWTEISTPHWSSFRQSTFSLTVDIDPSNPDFIIIAGINWNFTQDGGETWHQGIGLGVDYHHIYFEPTSPNKVYLGYDQGFGVLNTDNIEYKEYYVSTQPRMGWIVELADIGSVKGFNTEQVYHGDFYPEKYGDAMISGLQDAGCQQFINNISKRVGYGDGGSVFVNKQNPDQVITSHQSGGFSRTDKGIEGEYVDKTSIKVGGYHEHFITQLIGNNADGSQIYIPQSQSIYRSTDNGKNFEKIVSHKLHQTKLAIQHSVEPVLYCIGRTSNISMIRVQDAADAVNPTYKRYDFTKDQIIGEAERINIDPNDKNTVFVTTVYGRPHRISKLNTDTPEVEEISGNIQDVKFTNVVGIRGNKKVLLAGTNIGLFYSEDGGENWILSPHFPYTKITDIKLRRSDNRLFVFTFGRGAWATNINVKVDTKIKRNTIKASVYPNPVKDNFSVNVQDDHNVSIALYDITGKLVLKTDELKNINVSHLSRGAYILHIIEDTEIVALEKVMLQ
ncbi:T9SS type A sorting domain-containing protein [Flavobacteriaceae bacterium]|nr:T9SS type A sorting domain-containing protein [Flavobacteriaceae bacterium]